MLIFVQRSCIRSALVVLAFAGCERGGAPGCAGDAPRGVQSSSRPEPSAAPDAGVESSLTPLQRAAIGPLDTLSPEMRRALSGKGFAAPPPPGPNDWRTAHPEPGQTFEQFVASQPNMPDAERRMLTMVPLGEVPAGAAKPEVLRAYAEAFFALPARLLPPIAPGELSKVRSRTNASTGKKQLLTPDLLKLLQSRIARDAFSLSAFTSVDLFPDDSWNYVFGQASLSERVGVFSFARYDPAFFGEAPQAGDERKFEHRALRVMTHETGHMFGLKHCVHFTCVMNGANHMEEADRWPLHFCPVCLRKLQRSIGFDVVARYQALERFYSAAGLADEAAWTRERLADIRQ